MTRSHFNIDPDTSIITNAKYICSPNYDVRPPGTEVDLLVIHGISLPPGKFNKKSLTYITDLFTNQLDPSLHPYFTEIFQLKVSCHCLINRAGILIQYVPFKYRAWHAGVSCFNGRTNCNDFSIGIELEGSDDLPYTNKQYKTLSALINDICRIYKKITLNNIVGHSDIASDRKTDPGNYFDWQKLQNMLKI